MSTSISLPKGFNLLFVEIKRWHGKRKLNNKDLGIEQIDKRLANLGNVSMIDPKLVNQFRNLANRANTLCEKYGVRFSTGWAINDQVYNSVLEELKLIQSEWYATKREVMSKYEVNVLAWANEAENLKKGFGEVVMRGAYSADYVESQIQFEIRSVDDIVDGLGNSLIEDIASKFSNKHEQLLTRYAENKTFNITRRDLIVVNEVREKLLINSLLSPAALPLLSFIDDMLNEAGDGELSNSFCDNYVKNVALLTTPQLIYGLSSQVEKADNTQDAGAAKIGVISVLDGGSSEIESVEEENDSDVESTTDTTSDTTDTTTEATSDATETTSEATDNDENNSGFVDQVIVHDEYSQVPIDEDLQDIFDDFENF